MYVTDGLKVLGGLNMRYADIFKVPDNRSPDDIIGNIKAKLVVLGENQ